MCPCFSLADVDAVSVVCDEGEQGECAGDFSAACGDGTTVFRVRSDGHSQCTTFTYTCSSTDTPQQVITLDQFDACVTLLEPFLSGK